MPDPDVIKQSVTKNDYAISPQGGAFFFHVGQWPVSALLPPTLENLSLEESDYITISTVDQESLWAGAVSIAITKITSLSWEVNSDVPLRSKRAQELLLGIDAGQGWVSGLSKLLQDFLTTNNGCFLEVVRATSSPNSAIIGLMPLDSLRCQRTGNAEYPVIYTDLKGAKHQLRTEDVICMSDMPSNRASMYGSGKCAAARAYPSIYEMACIQRYISDKVSGRRPLAVNLINGLNDPQLRSVLATAQAEADARGVIAYMGAIIATVPGDATPGLVTIPLADFPDNFDRSKEFDIAMLAYANNIGLDVQDLQPLTGRALGTGAQSETLDAKAKGKGLAAFRQQLVHNVNAWVLPDKTTMEFIEKDWRDKLQRAEVNAKVEAYVVDTVKNGVLKADQGLQVLVDEDVYDKDFLPVDETPDTSLSDIEKPGAEVPEGAIPALPDVPQPAPAVPQFQSKEAMDLIEQEAQAAVDLARKIEEIRNATE